MNRFVTAILGAASASALLIVSSPPAQAVAGEVVVFSTEFQRVDSYKNPEGCTILPVAAHVLVNQSSSGVVVHGDPLCLTPGVRIEPGYGSHVPPMSGSFSISR
ncbi:hypothetical protein GCM10027598_60500 [Amycolatopsis oliviviridis]|uniref:Secreted protein n=1 Tax=Amycolatopsis oliviviridis TaxID=1471590 RepID=A0ABQ3MCI1_9PSEU|nr:hypothetical protein [Amycolatopsis oliviviridis]GHH38221.1 hypothetical protein GCM10017790_83670 [Amycolatopsis oliviviridis]